MSGYPDGTFKPNNSVTRAEFTVMLVGALKLDSTGVALDFTDQDKIGAWAKQAVALAVQAGIVSGRGGNNFVPNDTATRAEAVVKLLRMLEVWEQEYINKHQGQT